MAKESPLILASRGIKIGSVWVKHKNNSNTLLLVSFCFLILVLSVGRHSNILEKYVTQVYR